MAKARAQPTLAEFSEAITRPTEGASNPCSFQVNCLTCGWVCGASHFPTLRQAVLEHRIDHLEGKRG